MKVEEQIKQAARSYAELEIEIEAGYVLTARNAFIAGANFGMGIGMKEIFEWRDCFDDPPSVKNEGYHIVCKDEDNTLAIEYILKQSDCDNIRRGCWTYWKPLGLEGMRWRRDG